ncbi:acetate/propionate family kinase [Cupriavidus plantarum]|uniref:acetate/propionate family kinase n=1 Tax=Cupriavidus plantarum TaxID=942865 RepID=UPI001B101541|nr:acetate/propionate family kinase [Cupriavidus plantarum]CAG2128004.1 Acetate kinase [Cupriavidus plantarum]SMR66818.1 acetate kinase [Cupriavidus plantarum]
MSDLILVLNAGSSSIKFRAYDAQRPELPLVMRGAIDGLYTAPRFRALDGQGTELGNGRWNDGAGFGHAEAVDFLAEFLRDHAGGHTLAAVGHRVVHGGRRFTGPVRATPAVVTELATLRPLAPLHQLHNLKPIEILLERRPRLPQVACFDTAFHVTQHELAQAFALPQAITDLGVRRYGFHGLSYDYIASVLPRIDARAAQGATVVAHLGNGSSMCAMRAGCSVASTMGFTAVDGLPMGTRSGSLDPGVILFLMDELKLDVRAVEDLLYRRSGLLGVSGISSDMRELLASDAPRARLAISLYIYRIGRELGSLAAALQGLDTLVFTAGVGENAAYIRQQVCQQAAWLGVALNDEANARGEALISGASSRVAVRVIPTDEELMIARQTRAVAFGGDDVSYAMRGDAP